MKAQGDGDPLRISSSLQRVNMFMVSHNSFFPYTGPGCPVPVVFLSQYVGSAKEEQPTGPGCPVPVVFLSRATVREAPATILMIVSESPFFAAPVSSCYLYQILVAVLLQFPVM
jgi:TusA-related sulfurtransferase